MKFSVYQASRKGGRAKNEDRAGYCYTRDAGLFALADGMGGHPEGEVASQLALQTISELFKREARPKLADPATFLLRAISAAHQEIIGYAVRKGMGDTPRTTVVVCVVQGGGVHWAHCGDSRLYVVRADTLHVRTLDHSYSQLRDSFGDGMHAERVNRNVLFTCLGSPGRPLVDAGGPMLLEPGDRLLLCSDGLWSSLQDDVITKRLSSGALADSVSQLVEQALDAAGPTSDNVTALALEWEVANDPQRAVSTQELSTDMFESTIEAAAAAGATDDLDDAAIEQAIREINDAIRRSSRGKP